MNIEELKFDDTVFEELNYYVYALYKQGSPDPFYIGKGNKNRVYDHVKMTLKLKEKESEDNLKFNIIRKNDITHRILRHGLSENTAFEIEATIIDFIGLDDLSNKVRGKGSYRGIMTVDEIKSTYKAPIVKEIPEKVILININKKYADSKNDTAKLYKAVKGDWVLGDKRKAAKYAFAVSYGIVREIFTIEQNSWRKEEEVEVINKKGFTSKKRRWSFSGEVCRDVNIRTKYKNCSVRSYWESGSQNPIRYTF